ncbi:MAG: hypothetical protein SP4CHLAM5_06840 [Chlamydiia bacterium]|nr:hypothetical protein [Chlamydiia bacterium]MCH9618551.1 hypothetical protein [Chlamydiia bacterium]MCH9624259.1 hypothetical protein [Chlamydiia bacterium]
MKLLLLALIPFLGSCNSKKEDKTAILHTHHHNDSLRLSRLSHDEIFILEMHYPVILKKILIGENLRVREVITLHEIGLRDEALIHLIKYTGSIFMLTADDVVKLQLGGVPLQVINLMIES